jgi:type II secretory pathway component GspD/PulD (secretin)
VLAATVVGITAIGCAHPAQKVDVGDGRTAADESAAVWVKGPPPAPTAALLAPRPSAPASQPSTGTIEFSNKRAKVDPQPDPWQISAPPGDHHESPDWAASTPGEPPDLLPVLYTPTPVDDRQAKRGSMHFDNIEINKALEILSRDGGFNILVSPAVKGNVTANIKDATAEEALDAVLTLTGLVKQQSGRFTYIYTPEEVRNGNGPDQWISTRIYHLNYVRSTDFRALIADVLTPAGKITMTPEAGGGGPGGHGGSAPTSGASGGTGGAAPAPGAGAAAPTSGGPSGHPGGAGGGGNSHAGGAVVIVTDTVAALRQIDQIVAELDVPPLQVDIEAVLLSVEHDLNEEMGINVAIADTTGSILGVIGDGSKLFSTAGVVPGAAFGRAVGATAAAQGGGGAQGGAVQGAGFISPEHGLKFGSTRGGITELIRALKTTGKVTILARPHLLVLNNQEASLLLGDKLGYATLSQSAVSTTQNIQFLNVGTKLHVQPFISDDGLIRMMVHPERSSGRVIDNIPQASTSEVTTDVMVPDGATLIIAGLVDDVKDRSQNGLPFLSELPGIGVIFRERFLSHTHKELVVLLTPHIWDPGRAIHARRPFEPEPISCCPVPQDR